MPQSKVASRCLSMALSLALVAGQFAGALAHAQTYSDIKPPTIRIDPLASSVAEYRQAFTAWVSDEEQLAEVILYMRRAGEPTYRPMLMRSIGESDFFNVSIDTDPSDLRAFEYYVQAHDLAGNRAISGYAFDPYRRELTPPAVELASLNGRAFDTAGSSNDRRKWWAIALGVLAAGAVASLASGGSSDSRSDAPTVPLSLNIQEP